MGMGTKKKKLYRMDGARMEGGVGKSALEQTQDDGYTASLYIQLKRSLTYAGQ